MSTPQLIALVGPPASGKGTLARRLSDYINAMHFETGALLREESDTDPVLGRQLAAGEMASDEQIERMLRKRLQHAWDDGHSVVLDGAPRRVPQLQTLVDSPYGQAERLRVLALDVPSDVVRARALSRGEGRSDDTREGIERRLELYQNETQPVLKDPTLKRIPFCLISGTLPPDEVYELAIQTLKVWDDSRQK